MNSYGSRYGKCDIVVFLLRKPLSLKKRGVCNGLRINRYQNTSKPKWSLVMVWCTPSRNAIGLVVTNPMVNRRVLTQKMHRQLCLACVSWCRGAGITTFSMPMSFFASYYSASSTRANGPGPLLGRKKSKQHITFMLCTNVDGSKHLAPLMIGKAQRPRCFGSATPGEEGIDYELNAKAWMTTIFLR